MRRSLNRVCDVWDKVDVILCLSSCLVELLFLVLVANNGISFKTEFWYYIYSKIRFRASIENLRHNLDSFTRNNSIFIRNPKPNQNAPRSNQNAQKPLKCQKLSTKNPTIQFPFPTLKLLTQLKNYTPEIYFKMNS